MREPREFGGDVGGTRRIKQRPPSDKQINESQKRERVL